MNSTLYEKDFYGYPMFTGKTYIEVAGMVLFGPMPEDFPIKIESKKITGVLVSFSIENYCTVTWFSENQPISIVGAYQIGCINNKSKALFCHLDHLGFITDDNRKDVEELVFGNRSIFYLKRLKTP